MDNIWRPSSAHQKSKSHSRHLGRLWTDLNSLETALRLALCEIEGAPHLMAKVHAIFEAKIGTVVGNDHFTRQTQLHDLIEMFNEHAASLGVPRVEPEIGEIRHALAHGRVTSISEEDDIRLVNFKGKKGGDLVICYSATLTGAWFKQQRKRIHDAIGHVHSLSKILQTNPWHEIIIIGNVSKKDISSVILSQDIAVKNPAHRFLIIVASDTPQDGLEELRELIKDTAKIVRL